MLLALTRPVPPTIANCELTHVTRVPIDWGRAVEQHERYESALRAAGCTVERLAGDPSHPDSVFIEDTAVVVDELAIITRPGATSRRGETDVVAAALSAHREIARIQAPGTLDGGDVLRLGRRVYVGLSSRTNAEGARQLLDLLEALGYRVEPITVRDCLHLKSAATALGDDRVLLNPCLIDGRVFDGLSWMEIDPAEPTAANVVSIDHTVLCSANVPRTQARLAREGYDVRSVDASELAKAEGALTCCSLLLRA